MKHMETYKVKVEIGFTTVKTLNPPFKMSVRKDIKANVDGNTALMEAILYKEDGVFVKDCSYLFEALNKDHNPISKVSSIDNFKAAVDFFFKSVLNTEYYLKSIPKLLAYVKQNLNRCSLYKVVKL
jgi:hypothetical protein